MPFLQWVQGVQYQLRCCDTPWTTGHNVEEVFALSPRSRGREGTPCRFTSISVRDSRVLGLPLAFPLCHEPAQAGVSAPRAQEGRGLRTFKSCLGPAATTTYMPHVSCAGLCLLPGCAHGPPRPAGRLFPLRDCSSTPGEDAPLGMPAVLAAPSRQGALLSLGLLQCKSVL